MDPYEVYRNTHFRKLHNIAMMIGFNIFNPKGIITHTLASYLFMCVPVMFAYPVLYTFVYKDVEQKMLVCFSIGLLLQESIMSHMYMTHYKNIRETFKFFEMVYIVNKRKCTNRTILDKYAKINDIILRFNSILYLGALAFGNFVPLPIYLMTGVRTARPIFFPGIDENTTFGYLFMYIAYAFYIAIAIVSTITYDFTFSSFIVHRMAMAGIFEHAFEKLNRSADKGDVPQMKMQLRNILMMHQDLHRLCWTYSQMTFGLTTATIYMTGFMIVLFIYIILSMSYPAAYALFVCGVAKIFSPCLFGTINEITNDRIYYTLVQSKYYLLPKEEQQKFNLMLLMAQNSRTFMCGVEPMNLSKFLSIIHSVYSIAMLLRETV